MARWNKLGIIAGGGALPARIAAACRERSDAYYIIRISGAADETLDALPGEVCFMGEAGKILRVLKANECDAVVFAGIVHRPNFSSLKADWRGAALLPKIIAAAARGDSSILDILVQTVESEGLLVVGAEEVMHELSAPGGALGDALPSQQDFADMRKAAEVIRALGSFDIGQAAVVSNGHVLAVEAAEGTDAMLDRCARLLANGDKKAPSGVLVKRPKPGQELRVDLPVVGPETVRRVREAGLAGIAVEAGAALIIDADDVVRLANDAGLFVFGFTNTELETA